ncbi:anti-anti-sigma factor [Asanoa hainanensis]|uniref:Anti-anti-sigma factor n=1 Tax=Asanoa hainanensis TaxID=560556 RepID=A0A239N751_9ACTN|nr:STAS domain-containing protein [Asanoa hainanensis]SNT49999.1 anti-anti-sigma factor [Asanoa hainanensis]
MASPREGAPRPHVWRTATVEITCTDDGVVTVVGDADIAAETALLAAIRTALAKPTPVVVVDLTAATFLDARAVSVLVGGFWVAAHEGRQLRLTGVHGVIGRVLDATGTLALLTGDAVVPLPGIRRAGPHLPTLRAPAGTRRRVEPPDDRRALSLGLDPGVSALTDVDFLATADRPLLIGAVLEAALTSTGATAVDVQRVEPGDGSLHIVGHHGFGRAFLDFFAQVDVDDPTACAAALRLNRPIEIDDVTRHPIFAGRGSLAALRDAGTRSVYSYPLAGPSGAPIGVLSFHYARPSAERASRSDVALAASAAMRVVVNY